ncbi:putative EF-hand domain, mechanosensitive ion channel MscS, LSM domain superfamily [Septoria linicola]|nr:putative EF-hand domain, mechanosensitive ion channel MscS, LSM domain superfamily [Septoria linicola]
MSSHLHPRPSQTKRFSREGFQPIPAGHSDNMAANASYGGNDATIDIPLEQVQTNASSGGGRRNASHTAENLQPMNTISEKQSGGGFFRGRRVKQVQDGSKKDYEEEVDALTTMGKVYNKILNFSIVTRYFLYVLPLGILIAVPIIVGSLYSDQNAPTIAGVRLVWFFTWIEVVWLSLWVSKLVAHFLPYLFQMLVGVVSSGVRKYANVIRKLEIPLSLVGWAVTSLATFKPLMTNNPYNRKVAFALNTGSGTWIDIVQKILAASVVCTLVFLGEKFIIQLISINYHAKQFNSRIRDSKRQVYMLGLLYDASTAIFPQYCREFAEEDYEIADAINIAQLGGKKKKKAHHRRSGSATPMRMLQTVGRVGDKVTSAFGNVASEITGKAVFNPNSSHSIVVEALEKRRTSEALARRIWMSLVVEGNEELSEDDIIEVMGPERRSEAEEAYEALDRDGNGDISLDEMIQTVVEWGRERKAIATSMVDVAQAISVLDRMLCTVVLVAVVFIFVGFLNANFVTTLATTGTALLSLSFVFSVTAQEVLGSCIFLFVKHPFDVGDRVDIAGDAFIVEHISLLYTVFKRAYGVKTGQLCQYPNVVLNSLSLDNVSRSTAQTEHITLDISFDTSFDDIQILKNELKRFVTDKENNRDFQPDVEVEVLGTSDMSKLQLKVEIRHKSNWSNETLRAARRSKFMCALVAALRAVPIYGPGGGTDAAGSAANPNYSVAISDSEAKENAEHAADGREKLRMVPTKSIDEAKAAGANMSPTTSRKGGLPGLSFQDPAIGDLNARNPARDDARDTAWATGRDDSSSTLGERPSIDQQDLNDVRGLLERASTRGKRKPSIRGGGPRQLFDNPSIPTISEPRPAQPTSFEQQRPVYPMTYGPTLATQPTQFQSAQGSNAQVGTSPVEMSQFPQRTPSNPYRARQQPGQLNPTPGRVDEDDDEFGNMRPYSGV